MPRADLDVLMVKIMDRVAEPAKPEEWAEGDLDRRRRRLTQWLIIDVDLEQEALPPRATTTMARANIELQRMARSMVSGDLDAYLARLDCLKLDAVRTAVAKHATPKSPSIVRVQSAKGAK